MGNTANTSFPSRRDITATSCPGFNLNSNQLKLSLVTKAEEGLPTSDFGLRTSDFGLPTSDFKNEMVDVQRAT